MNRLVTRIGLSALFASILVLSCSVPDGLSPEVTVTPSISFADRDDSTVATVRAAYLAPADSLQPLVDFYDSNVSGIGTPVGSYTPTKFRLFIDAIVLYNDTYGYQLDIPVSVESETDPSRHYADFVEPVTLVPQVDIPVGTYTGLLFRFANTHSTATGSVGDDPVSILKQSLIEVTIPEYGGVAWPDQAAPNLAGSYRVRHLGSDLFEFAPIFLQPYAWQSIWESYLTSALPMIERFAYLTGSPYRAILPGQDGHPDTWVESDADATALPPGYESATNEGAVIVPFAGVTIPEDAATVEFSVQWDLDGIIEVFDHGTGGSAKTDDIVVLAANFWERFSLVPHVRYE